MTHKIAIIKTREIELCNNYGDDSYSTSNIIADSITDWEEVSDEDFRMLVAMSREYNSNFVVIEQPVNTATFIAKTISDYKKLAKEREDRLAKEKADAERKAQERKYKKELKDKESKLKLLRKLQEEFGEQVSSTNK